MFKKDENEKLLLINHRSNYDSINQTTDNDKNKKNDFCCYLLLVSLGLMSILFLSGCLLNFYMPYKYENVFKKIEISSRFDSNTYLPIVDFKLNDIKLIETKLITGNDTNNDFSFYKRINQLIFNILKAVQREFKLDTEKNLHFKLDTRKFKFNVEKLNTYDDEINCFNLSMISKQKKDKINEIETCVNLGDYSWFGGHESLDQPYWPINNQTFGYVPYVTGYVDAWGALYERYWLSSAGISIFIDDDIPLFVNHLDKSKICFKSDPNSAPYKYTQIYSGNDLEFTLCRGKVKKLHMYMIKNYLNIPAFKPDTLMMQHPVFTTWNYYFKKINQSIVIDFAEQIAANNYTISQLEIDDKWEEFYGNLDFDTNKFPNVKQMVSKLHEKNMRCTLWVHPFTNIDSRNFVNGTENGYWILDAAGQHPGLTSWWNGKNAAILDTTNPKAVDYFTDKLNTLKSKYGIDSFKFDAGETSWIPPEFKFSDSKAHPDVYAQNYARLAADQNYFVEVRTGHRNQEIGIFYRILDRATDWTIHDGIKSVVTATLQFGLLGYPFVLPDIIGGNGDPDKKNKELFIRWTQLTAFLPAMQFGVPPWYFDEETNLICKKFVEIHETKVYPYMRSLPLDGQPLIRPMFWLEESDNQEIFKINDQFLVGDQIMVAPVLEQNATSRQIYIPNGRWYDANKDCYVIGPNTIDYILTLDTIPYFFADSNQIQTFSTKYFC